MSRPSLSLLLVCLLWAEGRAEGAGTLELQLPAESPEVFERVEIIVSGMPAVANPFDPEVACLDLEVTAPSGQQARVPGFFYREFDRRLEGRREVLTAQGDGDWHIRWLPSEPGHHTLIATATLAGEPVATGEAVVEVAPGTRHGLVRVEPEGKRYFRLDDGAPLFLNGLCACWHGSRGTYDYDDWLEAYQKAGINYIRIWRSWKPDADPHFRALHQALWSGAFTGAAGTGMTWWWEHIHTGDLYHHWSSLAAFLAGTGIGRADLRPARWENAQGPLIPYGVAAHDEALVWLLDRACDWPDGAMDADPAPVTGAAVTLVGVDNGVWSVAWWDTLAGKCLASGEITATDNALRLEPPAFQVDIAARMTKKEDPR